MKLIKEVYKLGEQVYICKVCGREFSKWRFCLECGEINHAYTNKYYIGE